MIDPQVLCCGMLSVEDECSIEFENVFVHANHGHEANYDLPLHPRYHLIFGELLMFPVVGLY